MLDICVAATGASFIVFNVPINQTMTRARCSIVEDGIVVQLPRRGLDALCTALRSGDNFSITDCDSADVVAGSAAEELVIVRWIDDVSGFDLNER